MKYIDEKKQIIEYGKRAYNRGFVAANDGNISVKIGNDKLLITASGKSKGFLDLEDILLIDFEGNLIDGKGKVSSEYKMHSMVYQERKDVKGIFHAHPVYATTLAVAGIALDEPILVEVIISCGAIPLVEYATPGSSDLPNVIKKYVHDYQAFLLEKHGALSLGNSIEDAYYRMETIEHFSHIVYNLKRLDKYQTMDKEEIKKLFEARSYFGINKNIGIYPDK